MLLTATVPLLPGRSRRLPPLLRGRRGVTTAMFALSLTAVLGVVGLGTEAGMWYEDYVQMQGVADAAAMSGAVSVSVAAEQASGGPVATATYVAAQNGFSSGSGGVTVTVNYPPASGAYQGNTNAVETIISKTEPLRIAKLFLANAPTVTVRSVALYAGNAGSCVLALGQAAGGGNGELTMSGGASLNAGGCSVASNNTGGNAIDISPSPQVTAYTVQSAGGINFNCYTGPPGCGTNFNLTQQYSANHVATADPLAAVQDVPLPSSNTFNPGSCSSITSTTTSVSPGTYCTLGVGGGGQPTKLSLSGGTYTIDGGINVCTSGCNIPTAPALQISSTSASSTFYINGSITIQGSSNAVLDVAPGTYFIYNGSLDVGNSGSLTCSACVAGGPGVTFVLMGNNPGTVNISGSSPMTLSAPATSNYNAGLDGVAIYQVPTDTGTSTLGGSGTINVQGAVYMPGGSLNISGAAGTSSATCSVFVANSIALTGSGYATDSACASYGYAWAQTPTPSKVSLVE